MTRSGNFFNDYIESLTSKGCHRPSFLHQRKLFNSTGAALSVFTGLGSAASGRFNQQKQLKQCGLGRSKTRNLSRTANDRPQSSSMLTRRKHKNRSTNNANKSQSTSQSRSNSQQQSRAINKKICSQTFAFGGSPKKQDSTER